MLFLSWDLKYTGLVTNFGPVTFVPWGTSRRLGRSKTHNEKASTAQDLVSAVGVKGIITRHFVYFEKLLLEPERIIYVRLISNTMGFCVVMRKSYSV